jgi:hypothetical protein
MCLENTYDLKKELTLEEVNKKLKQVSDSLQSLVEYKNTQYNNAMYEKNDLFPELTTEDMIKLYIRVKFNRIKKCNELRKNDIADLYNYLKHLCVVKGWTNFDEFKD